MKDREASSYPPAEGLKEVKGVTVAGRGESDRRGAPTVADMMPTVREIARQCRARGDPPEHMLKVVKDWFGTAYFKANLNSSDREAHMHRAVACAVEEYYCDKKDMIAPTTDLG